MSHYDIPLNIPLNIRYLATRFPAGGGRRFHPSIDKSRRMMALIEGAPPCESHLFWGIKCLRRTKNTIHDEPALIIIHRMLPTTFTRLTTTSSTPVPSLQGTHSVLAGGLNFKLLGNASDPSCTSFFVSAGMMAMTTEFLLTVFRGKKQSTQNRTLGLH